jgi:hypothetical protein
MPPSHHVAQHLQQVMICTGSALDPTRCFGIRISIATDILKLFVSVSTPTTSAYDLVVQARGKALAMTDISVAIPSGCYGRVGMACGSCGAMLAN